MESINARYQVRFLQRTRVGLLSHQSRITSHFLQNLRKQLGKLPLISADSKCTVRISDKSGLWIYHSKNDEGFESDSDQSEESRKSASALNCSYSSGSTANSSISDTEETDIPSGFNDGDFLIHAQQDNILSCHIPSGFTCVVLFTLRCEDNLELVAVECKNESLARKIVNATKNLTKNQSNLICDDPRALEATIPPPTEFADEKEPVIHHKPLVSIQSWTDRSESNAPDKNHKQPARRQSSKTQELIRSLEHPNSDVSEPDRDVGKTSVDKSCPKSPAAECGNSPTTKFSEKRETLPTEADKPSILLLKRMKSCEKTVGSSEPDAMLGLQQVTKNDNGLENATREGIVETHRKPGKINPSLAREIEAVLQAQLQGRKNATNCPVGNDISSVSKKAQPPDTAEAVNNVKAPEKTKAKSFLFKFMSDSSSTDSDSNNKNERGRTGQRQKINPNVKHGRTPSQPPPSIRHSTEHNNSSQNTYFIPTKAGVESNVNPYPKDGHIPGKYLLPFPQPQPVLVTARPAFPLRLPFSGRVKMPVPSAQQTYWRSDSINNQGNPHQLIYVQPVNQAFMDEMKRRRSRSQSPGRRLLPRAPPPPLMHPHFAAVPMPFPAPPSPPNYNSTKYRDFPRNVKHRNSHPKNAAPCDNSRKLRNQKDHLANDCCCDPRKVTFNAFATVQLVD